MDYKEKLALAKEALESGSYDKNTIEYIFPELRGSADEEIKRFLIHCVKQSATMDFALDGEKFNRQDIIAWLEKQGKSKFEQCLQEGDKIVTNEDGTHFNVSQLERVAKKEPKSAWSEEDELTRNALLNLVEMYYGCCFNKGEKNRLLDWLKSLKERMKGE